MSDAPIEVQDLPAAPAAEIPYAEEFGHLLYARGFLLTPFEATAPAGHWRRVRLGAWHLTYDPRNALTVATAPGGVWVALLGRALDLNELAAGRSAVARSLLQARLRGRLAYLEAVDDLVGRYLVIDGDHTGTRLSSDATAMRSVFYAAAPLPQVIAGHAQLVADVAGAGRSAFAAAGWLTEHGAYCLPGRATPFADVVQLTPNTELELETRGVHRVYPRDAPTPVSADDAVEELRVLLRSQVEELATRTPLMTSLTAGQDSRTTLAVTRSVHESVRYFTYSLRYGAHVDNAGHARDLTTARALADGLRLDHQVVTVAGKVDDAALRSVMARNSQRIHNRGLAAAYLTELPIDRLHLRSNLFEIGRARHRSQRRERPELTPEVMAGILCKKTPADPEVVAEFDAFVADTGHAGFDGYDPYDLFHWEHRAGVWLSTVYLESDLAHDTHTVLNSRRIFGLLLGVPLESRIRGDVYRGLLHSMWPELLAWPVNGRELTPEPVPANASPTPPVTAPTRTPGYDDRHRLAVQEHSGVETFELPEANGLSRHRIALEPNDPRGRRAESLSLEAMVSARDSANLLVVFHGATDRAKYEYPRFEWQSTLAEFDASVLYLADPVLALSPEITLGWYVGTADVDVSRHCARLVQRLADRMSATRVIMTGTSGGGFAALAASRLVAGSVAVPFAPQTTVSRYYKRRVRDYLTLAFPDHELETVPAQFADRLDMVEQYAKATDNYVYYVQNLRDAFHIREHLVPFAASAGITGVGGSSADGSRVIVLEDLREGHGPPPKEQFVEQLGKARKFLTQRAADRTS
ncbi:hypothetical protein [Jiangella alba]|uniref:Alpha/beta hydrolase family protein n=1 Tax=Jiangella alba TaxID=561176 RepID=A0A1H5H8L7_9ACTN|nr:hypothetical protein [Jiangella alba]SEE23618.1 hypothetical protein SAMN04488561_0768 [Jiangella alba]